MHLHKHKYSQCTLSQLLTACITHMMECKAKEFIWVLVFWHYNWFETNSKEKQQTRRGAKWTSAVSGQTNQFCQFSNPLKKRKKITTQTHTVNHLKEKMGLSISLSEWRTGLQGQSEICSHIMVLKQFIIVASCVFRSVAVWRLLGFDLVME